MHWVQTLLKSEKKRIVPRRGEGRPNIDRLNTLRQAKDRVKQSHPTETDIAGEIPQDSFSENPSKSQHDTELEIPLGKKLSLRAPTQDLVNMVKRSDAPLSLTPVLQRHDPIVCERVNRHHRHVRRTIIRQDRHETIHQHVLQPIHDTQTIEEPETEILMPEEFETVRETEMSQDDSARYKAIYAKLAEQARQTVPTVTHEYVDEEPIIEEQVIRHVVQEVHPIIERDIYVTHVIREVKHVNRKRVDSNRVTGLHVAEAISLDEWQQRLNTDATSLVPTRTVPV